MAGTSKIRSWQLIALACFGIASSVASRAHASGTYPAELSKALERQFPGQSFCVPLCTACHNTTKGGPRDLNTFGEKLGLPKGRPELVDPALDAYFRSTPPDGVPQANTHFVDGTTRPFFDSDADGISDYTELQNYDSPSLALPRGEKEFCPDVSYGCFARVAAAPPPADRFGLFSAALLVLGLTALRRHQRAPGIVNSSRNPSTLDRGPGER